MTVLTMKQVQGGGYYLDVGTHRFEVKLHHGPTHYEGGGMRTRAYYPFVDGIRHGGPFYYAEEAKGILVPYVERAEIEARVDRQKKHFWEVAETIFPAGVPDLVRDAIEQYSGMLSELDSLSEMGTAGTAEPEEDTETEPEREEERPETDQADDDPPEPDKSDEPVAATAAKVRRSRAKSTTTKSKSKTAEEAGQPEPVA